MRGRPFAHPSHLFNTLYARLRSENSGQPEIRGHPNTHIRMYIFKGGTKHVGTSTGREKPHGTSAPIFEGLIVRVFRWCVIQSVRDRITP